MNMDYLKVEDLKHNYTYRIRARNGRVGVWDAGSGEFLLYRVKFNDHYTFGEIHYDHFGTARPYEELEECPLDVTDFSEKEMLAYLKRWEVEMMNRDYPHPKERP